MNGSKNMDIEKKKVADVEEPCNCYAERTRIHYLSDFERGVRVGKGLPNVSYETRIDGICLGTRDSEPCNCGGSCLKCDFYPEVKKTAQKHKQEADKEKKAAEKAKAEQEFYKNAYNQFVENQNKLIQAIWGKEAWLLDDKKTTLEIQEELNRLIRKKYKVGEFHAERNEEPTAKPDGSDTTNKK